MAKTKISAELLEAAYEFQSLEMIEELEAATMEWERQHRENSGEMLYINGALLSIGVGVVFTTTAYALTTVGILIIAIMLLTLGVMAIVMSIPLCVKGMKNNELALFIEARKNAKIQKAINLMEIGICPSEVRKALDR